MTGSINFSGISSGIDTNSIITELTTIARQPETLLKAQVTTLQNTQKAYTALSAALINLQAATAPLDKLRAFNLVTASSSDATVATVSAATGAQTGTHAISVTALAQAQVISSTAQSSQTGPLNQSGQIIINGKAISYQAADSLQTLASSINAAQAGVTASIITPTAGQYYLTLGSANSGIQGKINISDAGSGTLLSGTSGGSLGLFAATSSFAHTLSAGGYGSGLFADSATSVSTLEGQATPATGNVKLTIGGTQQSIAIDLSQSLSQIASAINNVVSGTAQVVSVTDPITNTSKQQLQLQNVTGFVDNNNVLANLGIVQKDLGGAQAGLPNGNQLTAAQDAAFTIDNLAATRPTNSFTDAISGVTINLLKANASTSLTVASDTATIKSNIQAFVTAYNSALTSITSQSQYDPTSKVSGALFGDSTASGIYDSLVSNANGTITGLPSSLSALSQIGITTDQSDNLQINDSTLSNALATNLSGVAQLFQASGTPTNPTIQFVSGTKNTAPSSSNGYAVYISTPASQASYTASTIQTAPLVADETLTFGGPLFSTSAAASPLQGHTIQLHAGASAADIVSQINADPLVGGILSASLAPAHGTDPGGELRITSKQYGASADFAVVSSAPASANSSGVGTTATEVKGIDVAGTINGEAAIGNGQFLTGSQTGASIAQNGKALGLQIRVAATSAGSYGAITYTSGVADILNNFITTQTDPYSGALTTAVSGIQTNITDIQSNIAEIETTITSQTAFYQQQFTAMEAAIAQLKASSAGLSALTGTTTTGSGSTGTSSSASSSSASSSTGTSGG